VSIIDLYYKSITMAGSYDYPILSTGVLEKKIGETLLNGNN